MKSNLIIRKIKDHKGNTTTLYALQFRPRSVRIALEVNHCLNHTSGIKRNNLGEPYWIHPTSKKVITNANDTM